ncbi:arsenate reductase (glutaredoxin) [Tahibacter soli]|uniref:Arsenate reductase n=1 Tax=Tahibacter soli TaxID=2983605 RepID=A0A9X3YQI2_9GAMM|nr:arsenate reductase (glutaredoxin) [Tahibacter soli]MDC8015098.1 arsenate reductase (glutaredoxin) [Tahibacter soli]
MSACTLYYNPDCSKCRGALELLEGRGIAPHIVRYLDAPPDAAALERLVGLLGGNARVLLRADEPEYGALGLDDPGLDNAALIAAIVAHPRLLQRPIVVAGGKAAIGRPPQRVLDIF